MKIVLCILTYNERPCLEVIFPRIPPPGFASGFDDIVAIDGGSSDGTIDYYEEHGIRIVGQSQRGRGDAFLQAFASVEADAYIFFSPDGNEAVEDLPRFRLLLEQGAHVVIASRMMSGARNEEDGKMFPLRKWANNAFNWLANMLFRREGPYITDSINGFRAITRNAARQLALDAADYTIEYQMTIRALNERLKIVEFPTIEGQRIAGETGAPSFQTGVRFLRRLYGEYRRSRMPAASAVI
jgi:glycosyltransferase involved in cell wall biosynthesis